MCKGGFSSCGEKQPQHDDGSGPTSDSTAQVHPVMKGGWREKRGQGRRKKATEDSIEKRSKEG